MIFSKEMRDLIKPSIASIRNYYIGTVFEMIIQSIMPILEACLIDEVIYNKNIRVFFLMACLYIILYIGYSINFVIVLGIQQYIDNTLVVRIKKTLLDKILFSPAKILSHEETGEKVTLITRDANDTFLIIRKNILRFANEFILFSVACSIVFLINWKIGVLTLVLVPFSVFFSHYLGKITYNLSKKHREALGEYSNWLVEVLSGMSDLHLLGAMKNVSRLFANKNKALIELDNKRAEVTWALGSCTGFIQLLVDLSLYSLAIYLIFQKQMTVGLFVATLSYYNSCKLSINNIIDYITEYKQRKVSIEKIKDKLSQSNENLGGEIESLTENNITFENVGFAYSEDKPILRGVNLEVANNEFISIVARSGEGKSTLLYLLLGLYSPTSGKISIAGCDVQNIPLGFLRKNICMVQTDSMFFPGTIRYNVCLGINKKVSDNEIYEILKKVQIYNKIMLLPKRLDTVIGENGIDLSEGEKQRIVLARMILKDCPIIVLDEATSAIDETTEEEIMKNLLEIARGKKTLIVISHRLSTIVNSDRIAILKEGTIKCIGTHAELMEECVEYQQLFKSLIKATEKDVEYD